MWVYSKIYLEVVCSSILLSDHMVLYAVYRASKDYSNRSLIPSRLRAIGCRQINKSFWEFDRWKLSKVLAVLKGNQPILLKRAKEVKKRSIVGGRLVDLGSLTVVSFRLPNGGKERVRSFLRKSPCIRLCRRVYAFYQRFSQFGLEDDLVGVDDLVNFVKEVGGEVSVFPNLIIFDGCSLVRLVDETRQRVDEEFFGVVQNCAGLYGKCLGDGCGQRQLDDALRKFRRQFVSTKRKAVYYEKWMGVDFSRSMMRAYRALLKLRRYSMEQKLAV